MITQPESDLDSADLLSVAPSYLRALALIGRVFRRPDSIKVLQQRKRWRAELRAHIPSSEPGYAAEIVVVQLNKIKAYPDPDVRLLARSASPWFKFEVKQVADDYLEVFSKITEVKIHRGKARETEGGVAGTTVFVVGRIPLERVAYAGWDPDPAYGLPRIYCQYGLGRRLFSEVVLFHRDGPGERHLYEMTGVKFKPKRIGFFQNLTYGLQHRRETKSSTDIYE